MNEFLDIILSALLWLHIIHQYETMQKISLVHVIFLPKILISFLSFCSDIKPNPRTCPNRLRNGRDEASCPWGAWGGDEEQNNEQNGEQNEEVRRMKI